MALKMHVPAGIAGSPQVAATHYYAVSGSGSVFEIGAMPSPAGVTWFAELVVREHGEHIRVSGVGTSLTLNANGHVTTIPYDPSTAKYIALRLDPEGVRVFISADGIVWGTPVIFDPTYLVAVDATGYQVMGMTAPNTTTSDAVMYWSGINTVALPALSRGWRHTVARFGLASTDRHRDTVARFKLSPQTIYHDTVTRFVLTAPLDTLVDSFGGSALNPALWQYALDAGTITEAGGVLTFDMPAGVDAGTEIDTLGSYLLLGSGAVISIATVPSDPGTQWFFYITWGGGASFAQIGMHITDNVTINCSVTGTNVDVADDVTYRHFAITFDGSGIHFNASPDGSTWTLLHTDATVVASTDIGVLSFEPWHNSGLTGSDSMALDGVNIVALP